MKEKKAGDVEKERKEKQRASFVWGVSTKDINEILIYTYKTQEMNPHSNVLRFQSFHQSLQDALEVEGLLSESCVAPSFYELREYELLDIQESSQTRGDQ